MRGSSSWKAFFFPPEPSRLIPLRVQMSGSAQGGQPDQQGRPAVQAAPADQSLCMLIVMPVVADIFYNSKESKLLNNPKYFVVPTLGVWCGRVQGDGWVWGGGGSRGPGATTP